MTKNLPKQRGASLRASEEEELWWQFHKVGRDVGWLLEVGGGGGGGGGGRRRRRGGQGGSANIFFF